MSGWMVWIPIDSFDSLYYYSFYLILVTSGLPAAKWALGLVASFFGSPLGSGSGIEKGPGS